jgi:hypothetical protein
MKQKKTLFYIKRAKEVHGNLYDYSKMTATTLKEKTIVICPEHGEFITTMDSHINKKSGCPSCHKVKKYTNEEWVMEVDRIHNHKYDYSHTHYTRAKDKVDIICHEKDEFGFEHGLFSIRAGNHMAGIGCPKCGGRYNMTQDEYLRKADKVHNHKYDYSKTHFTGVKNKITIICHEKDEFGNDHGEFLQNAGSHLSGCGCPKCNGGIQMSQTEFVERANMIHNNFYDYSNVHYETAKTKVEIICPVHGSFMQTPDQHLRGQGCPKCKSSIMESDIINLLNKNKIYYEYQSKILNLGYQSVDFYIPHLNIIIECQGEQHFIPTRFSKSVSYSEARKKLSERITLDKEKYEKAKDLNLNIVYYIDKTSFSRGNVNTFTEFYEDKTMFYTKESLEKFIITLKNGKTDNTLSLRDEFYRRLSDKIKGGLIKNGIFSYKRYGIFFQILEPCQNRKLYDMQRNYNKNNRSLIIVYEDEYYSNKELIIEKIKHVMGLGYKGKEKIYGRKCIIKEIEWRDANLFLSKNHIQGGVQSTIYLGAFYDNSLVGVMSFLNEGDNMWNLTRYASDNKYISCGVAGKIFNYFIRHYKYNEIKTFADKRWTINENNNLYTKLGFVLDKKLPPTYFYIDSVNPEHQRMHKFRFRRDTLIKKYGVSKDMTEKEMAKYLGYNRIWDCGLFKYVWKAMR